MSADDLLSRNCARDRRFPIGVAAAAYGASARAQKMALGEWFYEWMFAAEPRQMARARNRAAALAASSEAAAKLTPPTAVARFDGETPDAHALAHGAAEIIDLTHVDRTLRGKALRVDWPLRTLYRKGLISAAQFAAAEALRDLAASACVGAIGGQAWRERVDGTPPSRKAPKGALARRRYAWAMEPLGRQARALLERCIVGDESVADALARPLPGDTLPGTASRRAPAGMALLQAALDTLAWRLGVGDEAAA